MEYIGRTFPEANVGPKDKGASWISDAINNNQATGNHPAWLKKINLDRPIREEGGIVLLP